MSGSKFPKILAVIGIVFYMSINWYVVKFNNANIFDMKNQVITDVEIRNLISVAKIVITLIALLGITIELLRLWKKYKIMRNDFASEVIGICLNLSLLSFMIIPFWTLFYTPI